LHYALSVSNANLTCYSVSAQTATLQLIVLRWPQPFISSQFLLRQHPSSIIGKTR